MSKHRALENLTVLNLTRVLAGPFCTMMFADLGANVIKIELPGTGDDTRPYPPFTNNMTGERESLYFANVNRNKKGITLNLKSLEGKEIFKQLVAKVDIVVENYRPGVMDKLGLGYDVLKEINPRIIYGSVAGFGNTGHAQARMVTDVYSHTFDNERRTLAQKLEEEFFQKNKKAAADETTAMAGQLLLDNPELAKLLLAMHTAAS